MEKTTVQDPKPQAAIHSSDQPKQPTWRQRLLHWTARFHWVDVNHRARRFSVLHLFSFTLICLLLIGAAADLVWLATTSISVFALALALAIGASGALLLTFPIGWALHQSLAWARNYLPLPTPPHWVKNVGSMLRSAIRVALFIACLLAMGMSFGLSGLGSLMIAPTLPQTTGTLSLAGLHHPVTIVRDRYGVPHLYASDAHDLAEAQGFVTASDRYFQMDGAWRLATGHLAEAYGAGAGNSYLQIDAFMRTLGFDVASEQEYARMDPSLRAQFDAYTQGINAYLAQHQQHPPLEYTISSLQTPLSPAPWTSIKSLDVMRYFAFSFSDWYTKLVAGAIQEQGGQPLVGALYPIPPTANPLVISPPPATSAALSSAQNRVLDGAPNGGQASASNFLAQVTQHLSVITSAMGLANGHMGSNNWALDSTRTATGGALQAGDPHVPTGLPAVWYQIGLNAPGEAAIGASVPGMPGILLGHNQAMAFSMTISDLSDADLFVIQLADCPTGWYRYNGHCQQFQTRQETLRVAGGSTVVLTIQTTRTGAVVLPNQAPVTASGTGPLPQLAPQTVLALQTTLDDPTLDPARAVELATATTWSAFLHATDNLPLGLNWVVAFSQGTIGYRMSGVLPIRPAANVATPVDGSVSATAWRGYVPQAAMPRVAPGTAHILVTANNTIQAKSVDGIPIGDYPDQGFRARRISDLLAQLPPGTATAGDMQRIQNDVYSIPASLVAPTFIAVGQVSGGAAYEAAQLLTGWHDTITAPSVSAAVYELTLANVVRMVIEPKLGATLYSAYVNSSPDEGSGLTAVAINIVQHPETYFSGNREAVTTARTQIIAQAEQEAITTLTARFGSDSTQWRWGSLHHLTLSEQGFGDQPLIGGAFSVPPVARPGDETTIDMGGNFNQYLPTPDWSQTFGPVYRQVIDMAHLDKSQWILAPGESGQPFSRHFADQLAHWTQGDLIPMVTTHTVLAQDPGSQTLQLVPAA